MANSSREPKSMAPLRCFLVYPYVIHLELYGKLRLRGIAAVLSSDGEVQEEIVGLAEGVHALRVGVEGLVEIDGVQQQVVNGEADGVFLPVHPPDVELAGPV